MQPINSLGGSIIPPPKILDVSSNKEAKADASSVDVGMPVSRLRKATSLTVNVSKALLGVGILGYALIKIPAVGKFQNEVARIFGSQPSPVSVQDSTKNINGMPVDAFVGNYNGFNKIQEAILQTNISEKKLDLNGNNIVLDKSVEIKELITQLKNIDENKFKDEIQLLEEINVVSQLIWGEDDPHPYALEQNDRPNCQVMAAIQGQLFSEKNLQGVKGKVRVTAFNPTRENFRIDTMVELDGKTIEIPFETLVKWMSPLHVQPSSSVDGALSVPILTYALEEGLRGYTGVPNSFSSAPSTLLTGKDYCSIITSSLSDGDLIDILSKAPKEPVYLNIRNKVSQGINIPSATNYVMGDYLDFFSLAQAQAAKPANRRNRENKIAVREFINDDSYSGYKAQYFVQNTYDIVRSIQDNNSFPPRSPYLYDWRQRYNRKPEGITNHHIYTVKELKHINGQAIVTIIDSNDHEINLTLDDVRKYSDKIVTDANNIPNITSESLKAQLKAFLLITAILIGAYKVNKKINPNYRSTLLSMLKNITVPSKKLEVSTVTVNNAFPPSSPLDKAA